MVFIHGGGFFEGKAEEHPPNYLLEKDVVLVVPQYRLGPLGFLATKTERIPGNAALLDLKLALEWVQKNIANFGGDASNVTLLGQSAGAVLISALNFSPAIPDNLYHKVILQSGTSLVVWAFDDHPEANARDIAKIAGFNPKASMEELEDYFMKLDLQTMFKAHNKHMVSTRIITSLVN
jgi:acetylcholinesterase